MALHQTSGRWRLGLALALATAFFWATLPVALKLALEVVDAVTLTWFRFLVASIVIGAWLAWRGGLRRFRHLDQGAWLLLAIAALGLIGNYLGYLFGLGYTSPANAQLLIQLAPLLLAIGGVAIFRERLNLKQWCGYGAVALGLLLFFAEQSQRVSGGSYGLGVLLIVLAAAAWAGYALAQKQLLRQLDSAAILWVIYVAATVLLLPISHPTQLLRVDAVHWWAIAYCAINTIGAYGCFAEALAHWEASRVSAVLALTPILTVISVAVFAWAVPGAIAPERIGALGWAGAFTVVLGSAAVSLMATRRG